MELLYTDILPLEKPGDRQTITERFNSLLAQSDKVDIAVGYTSQASIEELDTLVEQYKLDEVHLTIGMYYVEGMPESAYHTAMRLNRKWQDSAIGEIRIVKVFKYHGKCYCFYKDNVPFAAIVGSANLGAIKLEANNRRQYEICAVTTVPEEVREVASHIESVRNDKCSSNIADIEDMPLIREVNHALDEIELVTSVPQSSVDFYSRCMAYVSFFLQLKVPRFEDRYLDDGKHFTKSNINVCYAAPRSKRKPRDWFETQLTVGAEIYRMEGYPEKNKPFFVVTDDGYWFKAHTTSDNNKQFSAVGDELIMGRWLKGRLAAAGIVKPVNNILTDTERLGMITQEMLDEYGCDRLVFKKTGQTALDEDGTPLDVWMLSFSSGDDV